MIRLIDGLQSNVVGLEAVGEVSAGDYKDVLDPAVDAALESNETIRLVYVLGENFDGYTGGAMWEDARIGLSHLSRFDKIALVTDHKGYADAVKAFGWLMPGEVETFAVDARDAAIAWVSS